MNTLNTILHELLGRKSCETSLVDQTRKDIHLLKNQVQNQLINVSRDVIKIKKHNNKELDKLTKKLDNITYNLSIVTGGIKNVKPSRLNTK